MARASAESTARESCTKTNEYDSPELGLFIPENPYINAQGLTNRKL